MGQKYYESGSGDRMLDSVDRYSMRTLGIGNGLWMNQEEFGLIVIYEHVQYLIHYAFSYMPIAFRM